MAGVSLKFLMVRETNSMVGYHLMAEGHSIRSRAAPWWGLKYFENFFEYSLKKMFDKLKMGTF